MKKSDVWVWSCPKCGCKHIMEGGINVATGLVCDECGYAFKGYKVNNKCRYCSPYSEIIDLEEKGYKVPFDMCNNCKKEST